MINIIASVSNNGCIGGNNNLLWKQSDDLKRFKSLTENNIVIMGKKTYESLPIRPLYNRDNIIITNNKNLNYEGCFMAHSIEESIEISKNIPGNKNIYIIGGGLIYKQFFSLADKLYITKILVDIDGDTYFPEIDNNVWNKVYSDYNKSDEKNEYDYIYEIYEKNKN